MQVAGHPQAAFIHVDRRGLDECAHSSASNKARSVRRVSQDNTRMVRGNNWASALVMGTAGAGTSSVGLGLCRMRLGEAHRQVSLSWPAGLHQSQSVANCRLSR